MELSKIESQSGMAPLAPPGLKSSHLFKVKLRHIRGRILPDKYEPVCVIGSGAMGSVTLARDLHLGRLVAIKTLRTDCSDLLARLREEAAILARLDHPSIVRVHALDLFAGQLYLTMEYLAGGNLALTHFEPIPLIRMLRGVVDALSHAHARGVVHRDVKPENILLTRRGGGGRAVLADFGLALGPTEGTPSLRRPIAGTPLTMSPEQVEGLPLGPASDIFSLGVTLYRQLTGLWPFRGRSVPDVFDAIRDHDVDLLRSVNARVPRRLDSIVRKMLEKDPAARFASMHELGRTLDGFLRARSFFEFFSHSPSVLSAPYSTATRRIHPEE